MQIKVNYLKGDEHMVKEVILMEGSLVGMVI